MTKFHEGQEVQVRPQSKMFGVWRNAKIVDVHNGGSFETYVVEFQSGVRVAFDSHNIRAVGLDVEEWKEGLKP